MKTLWDFIVKHEFWFSCLVVIGLWIAEDRTGEWWIGFLATLVLVTAFMRLASHPMWKKDNEQD